MAHLLLTLGAATAVISSSAALKTCPGFPGYCSESFPGQTCTVVCSFGRNNVPLCQDDGTWTDIPRCIEHEPGVDNQIPGTCPGIPGYCSQGFLNSRCKFDCTTGADIDSLCSSDGTWQPYPVCQGDLRETKDGCDGCPGPNGGARNRTAEQLFNNSIPRSRVPKTSSIGSARKNIPSFAGNTKFGLAKSSKPAIQPVDPAQSFFVGNDGRIQQRPATASQFNNQQQQQPARFPNRQQQPQQTVRQQPQQPRFRQQPQQTAQQPQMFQQGLNTFNPRGQSSQPLQGSRGQPSQPLQGSLFNQIKNRINQGNRQKQQQQPQQQQAIQQQQDVRQQQAVQQQQAAQQQEDMRQQQAFRQQQAVQQQQLAAQQQQAAARQQQEAAARQQQEAAARQQQQAVQQQQNPRTSLPIDSFLPEIRPQQQPQPIVRQQQPQQPLPAVRQQQQQQQQQDSRFGLFETVDLGNSLTPSRSTQISEPQPRFIERPVEDDFFGVFPTVDLQG